MLQTGDEIAELDQSGFTTQETTVWAGNIGQKKYNVQVCDVGVWGVWCCAWEWRYTPCCLFYVPFCPSSGNKKHSGAAGRR